MRRTLPPSLALLTATVIWGSTFVLVKEAIEDVPPFAFLAVRFAMATVALAVIWPRPASRLVRGERRGVLLVGFALAAGYGFQTVGLAFTGATNAGFITGLFVVFTPVLAGVVLERRPDPSALAAVALAAAGLLLLSLRIVDGRPDLSGGDLLVLVCAVAFALHIVALGRFAPTSDIRVLSIGQLAVATVVFLALAPIGATDLRFTARVWVALGVTALGATAYGFAVQTWAQRVLSPTRTAVILTSEPVFAGVFGYLWLGERLGPRGWLGAAAILAAMVIAAAGSDQGL